MSEGRKHKEERELIRKFEQALKNQENYYFDEECFIQIISYYITQNKLNHALKACDVALQYFPFSIEFTIEKAETLVKMEKIRRSNLPT